MLRGVEEIEGIMRKNHANTNKIENLNKFLYSFLSSVNRNFIDIVFVTNISQENKRCGIGSNFYLPNHFVSEKSQIDKYSPLADMKIFLSSGRCALKYIVKSLGLEQNDEVLLPSYLCSDMVMPFSELGLKMSYFKVNDHLDADFEDVISKVSYDTKLLVLIHYFGFPQKELKRLYRFCRENEILMVEDVVQSFLSFSDGMPIGSIGTFSINSYRKWLPAPDGCMLTVKNEGGLPKDLVEIAPPPHLFSWRFALRIKGTYARFPIFPSSIYRKLFAWGESHVAYEPSRMSNETLWQIEHTNFDKIVERRRKNFKIMLDASNELKRVKPFFDNLPEGICPIGFPVICKERDKLKRFLINRKIYPPVHWHLPNEISKDEFPISELISRSILTLPIDQRYSSGEIEIISASLREFDKNVL